MPRHPGLYLHKTMVRKNLDKEHWVIFEIVRDFLVSYLQFKTIYEKYKNKLLKFNDLDEFVTDKDPTLPLFNLKESCHMLFRYAKEGNCSDEEKLLDIAIGSIFHEAMKIRENLYQLEVYRPRYLQIRNRLRSYAYEKNFLQQFEKIGIRAEKRLAESMAEANRLFQDTLKQLADLLPGYKDNSVLMRFLIRNKHLLQRSFGKRKGLKVIDKIFPGGLREAYVVEGKSYLESEHYDLAADFFYQALKYKPFDTLLKILYLYARGMDGYYRNRYHESLRSFEKLIPFGVEVEDDKRRYFQKVEEICKKIGREYSEDKKKKLAHIAFHLADKVRRISISG